MKAQYYPLIVICCGVGLILSILSHMFLSNLILTFLLLVLVCLAYSLNLIGDELSDRGTSGATLGLLISLSGNIPELVYIISTRLHVRHSDNPSRDHLFDGNRTSFYMVCSCVLLNSLLYNFVVYLYDIEVCKKFLFKKFFKGGDIYYLEEIKRAFFSQSVYKSDIVTVTILSCGGFVTVYYTKHALMGVTLVLDRITNIINVVVLIIALIFFVEVVLIKGYEGITDVVITEESINNGVVRNHSKWNTVAVMILLVSVMLSISMVVDSSIIQIKHYSNLFWLETSFTVIIIPIASNIIEHVVGVFWFCKSYNYSLLHGILFNSAMQLLMLCVVLFLSQSAVFIEEVVLFVVVIFLVCVSRTSHSFRNDSKYILDSNPFRLCILSYHVILLSVLWIEEFKNRSSLN